MEGVYAEQLAGVLRLDVAITELWTEALQKPDLLIGQLDAPALGVMLQAEQAFVLGQEMMPTPDAPHAAGADLDAF